MNQLENQFENQFEQDILFLIEENIFENYFYHLTKTIKT